MASYNEKGDLESVENQVHQQEGILLCNSYLIILKMILKFLYLLLWNLSSVTKVTCGDYFLTTVLFFFFFFFFLQLALLDSSRHCADSAIKLFTMFPKNYTSFIVIPFHLKLFSVHYQRNITNKFIIHIFLSAIWLPTTNFGSLSIYLFLPVQGIQVCKVI